MCMIDTRVCMQKSDLTILRHRGCINEHKYTILHDNNNNNKKRTENKYNKINNV